MKINTTSSSKDLQRNQYHQTTSSPNLSENPSNKVNHHWQAFEVRQGPDLLLTTQTKDSPKPRQKGSLSSPHPTPSPQRFSRPEVTTVRGTLPAPGWTKMLGHLSKAHRQGGLENLSAESPAWSSSLETESGSQLPNTQVRGKPGTYTTAGKDGPAPRDSIERRPSTQSHATSRRAVEGAGAPCQAGKGYSPGSRTPPRRGGRGPPRPPSWNNRHSGRRAGAAPPQPPGPGRIGRTAQRPAPACATGPGEAEGPGRRSRSVRAAWCGTTAGAAGTSAARNHYSQSSRGPPSAPRRALRRRALQLPACRELHGRASGAASSRPAHPARPLRPRCCPRSARSRDASHGGDAAPRLQQAAPGEADPGHHPHSRWVGPGSVGGDCGNRGCTLEARRGGATRTLCASGHRCCNFRC